MTAQGGDDGGAGSILVVGDAGTVGGFLARLGYRVDQAASGGEALERLSAGSYDLLLMDMQMPGESGADLLAQVRSRSRDMRTILMSARVEAADAAAAIEHGVERLLLKPFELKELQAAVEKALAERRAQARTAGERELYEAMLRQRKTESKIWILRAAHALVTAVEAKDSFTRGHATRVTSYSLVLAEAIGGFDIGSMRLAGDLHDVGKIGVPDAVLNKPGPLTADEVEAIQKHPEIGRRILEPLIDDPLVIGVVRWHHERWDGSGYPDGLMGEEIPLAARILAVADTLDAATSSRAHREALPWAEAIATIRGGSGSLFDPTVVEALGRCLGRLESLHAAFQRAEPAS